MIFILKRKNISPKNVSFCDELPGAAVDMGADGAQRELRQRQRELEDQREGFTLLSDKTDCSSSALRRVSLEHFVLTLCMRKKGCDR